MPNDQSSDGFEDVVNRRNFLRLTGASGVAALAGCGGGGTTTEGQPADTTTTSGGGGDTTTTTSGGGGDTTTQDTGGNKVYDVTVDSVAARSMDRLDWNAQFAGWPNIWGRWLVFERFAQYNIQDNEWIPRLIQDWSIEGTTVTLNIRDPHNWANGDPVTADDIKANIVMNLATGAAFSEVFKSFSAPDDKTLKIETKEPVNKKILEFTILSNLLQAKMAPPYDKFYQQFWEENQDGVGKKIQQREPQQPDYVSGIFSQKLKDSQQYVLKRNPQHPDAENVNFKRYSFPTYTGNQNKWKAMMSDKVDTVMSVFTPSNIKIQLADHWNEYNFPGNWGVGLVPNHNPKVAPHISKRPVRQAMTHAINRQSVVSAAGPRVKTPFPTPAAISAKVQDKWIDVGGQFPAMQGGAKQAAKLMKDAGYAKNSDGIWAMDGDEVQFELACPSAWSDWVTASQVIVANLSDAGFGARLNRVSNIYGVIGTNKNFKLATRPWSPGNARSSFPYFPINWVTGRNNAAHYYQKANSGAVEVPAMSGSGTTEINYKQRLKDLSVARGDNVKPIVQELAWLTHQDLPVIPIIDKKEQSFISSADLTAPATDAPSGNVKWPPFYAPRVGTMQWKGE